MSKTIIILLCLLTGIASVLAITAASAAEHKNSALQCWSPSGLVAQKSEKYPRYLGKKAILPPPDISPEISEVKLPPVPENLHGSIRRVELPEGKKLIALTLDLCEAPYEIAGYDGTIIDYLREHNIKATLFTGGKWMLSHPVRTQQLIADPLFEIGNHAWTHGNFRKLKKRYMHREIEHAQKAYQKSRHDLINNQCAKEKLDHTKIPKQMTLFRFPYGACNAGSLKMVANKGLLAIQWDVVTGDPSKSQSAKGIARQILKNVKPGSIIIAHANGRGWNTAKALPLFIPQLLKQGYRFVTVSELLKAGKPVISPHCYNVVKGDTNRYDRRRITRKIVPLTDFDDIFQR